MLDKLEYADQTIVHPAALALWLLMSILVLVSKRSRALIPVFLLACFLTPAQRVTVLGFDFTFLRLLVLVGAVRVLSRGEHRWIRLSRIDKTLVAFVLVRSLANIALHGTFGALVLNLGIAFDFLGMYFLARSLIQDRRDLDVLFAGIAGIGLVLVVPFLLERYVPPHRNVFSIFGGISEFTGARQGKYRAHGAYPHAIIAGCYWVAVLPLVLSRFWTAPRTRLITLVAVLSCVFIVLATSSSTPLAGLVLVICGLACYPIRETVPHLRKLGIVGLIGLHLVMAAPVWHLISRIDLVGGSTGWHRYYLIDQAIHRFPEWCVIGTRSTAHWGHQLFDVTNQYVFEGVNGGVLSLVLFVALLVQSFGAVGQLVRAASRRRAISIQFWMLGVSMLSHTGMFIAVAYFGQIYSLWYCTLAAIASMQQSVLGGRKPPSRHRGRTATRQGRRRTALVGQSRRTASRPRPPVTR